MAFNFAVELELTDEAIQGLVEVEQMLGNIAEDLRGYVKDEELHFFTIEGWNHQAAKGVLQRSQRHGFARSVLRQWAELSREHESILDFLSVVRSGIFHQGTDRFVQMEARNNAAFADLENH